MPKCSKKCQNEILAFFNENLKCNSETRFSKQSETLSHLPVNICIFEAYVYLKFEIKNHAKLTSYTVSHSVTSKEENDYNYRTSIDMLFSKKMILFELYFTFIFS